MTVYVTGIMPDWMDRKLRDAKAHTAGIRPATHFVGFKQDQHFANAVLVFGLPDFIHPGWDLRAQREIADEDTVVFAKGTADQEPRKRSYNDPGQ